MKRDKIFFTLIGLGMFTTIIFFYRNYESREESFYQIVDEVRSESYHGTVINKFYDKFNHGRYKIIIFFDGNNFELELLHEKKELYDFIKVGDTLIKEKNQLELQIKRKNLDTIVKFKFDNVRGYEKYNHTLINYRGN